MWLEYKNGNLHKSSQDLDWNGKADAETHFEFGIAKFALIQANGETSFSRAEVYRPGGTLLREYRDTTGDGYLDTVLTYDLFGNEESEEKLGTPINPEARWLMERVEFQ